MVAHQDIGVNPPFKSFTRLLQQVDPGSPINIILEDGLATVAP